MQPQSLGGTVRLQPGQWHKWLATEDLPQSFLVEIHHELMATQIIRVLIAEARCAEHSNAPMLTKNPPPMNVQLTETTIERMCIDHMRTRCQHWQYLHLHLRHQ